MTIFEDLVSKNTKRILAGASAIRTLRDRAELMNLASHLAEIRKSTRNISLGGALRPNSSHLDFAIRKLEFIRDSHECLCALYEMDDLYDPQTEQKSGHIRILGTTLLDGKWIDFYECECMECGVRYRVEEREYHYTWWKWERLT